MVLGLWLGRLNSRLRLRKWPNETLSEALWLWRRTQGLGFRLWLGGGIIVQALEVDDRNWGLNLWFWLQTHGLGFTSWPNRNTPEVRGSDSSSRFDQLTEQSQSLGSKVLGGGTQAEG